MKLPLEYKYGFWLPGTHPIRIDGVTRKVLVYERMGSSSEEQGGAVVRLVLNDGRSLTIRGFGSIFSYVLGMPYEIVGLTEDESRKITASKGRAAVSDPECDKEYVAACLANQSIKTAVFQRLDGTIIRVPAYVFRECHTKEDREELARSGYLQQAIIIRGQSFPVCELIHHHTKDARYVWKFALAEQTVEVTSIDCDSDLFVRGCVVPGEECPVEIRQVQRRERFMAVFPARTSERSSVPAFNADGSVTPRPNVRDEYPKRIIEMDVKFRAHTEEEKLMVAAKRASRGEMTPETNNSKSAAQRHANPATPVKHRIIKPKGVNGTAPRKESARFWPMSDDFRLVRVDNVTYDLRSRMQARKALAFLYTKGYTSATGRRVSMEELCRAAGLPEGNNNLHASFHVQPGVVKGADNNYDRLYDLTIDAQRGEGVLLKV